MTTDAPTADTPYPLLTDWRLRCSLALTLIWVFLGIFYITTVVGWIDFATLNAPSLGGFLEGAFAPLAFLWLVVGFFTQQSQLTQNTRVVEKQLEVLRESAEQAKVQSRAIAADELHSRQDTYLRIAGIVTEQLGTIAGFLVTSWEADAVPQEERQTLQLWDRFGQGDRNAFSLRIIAACYTEIAEPRDLFYGTAIRTQHTQNFRRVFEQLIHRAHACDPEDMIASALRDSQNGRVHQFMVNADPNKIT